MVTKEMIQAAVDQYLVAVDSLDPDAYAATFAADAAFYDPPGHPPLVGREAIRQSVARSFGALRLARTTVAQVNIAGESVAFAYQSVLTARNGRTVTVAGIDTFEINAHGLIQVARFYWDPAPLRVALLG